MAARIPRGRNFSAFLYSESAIPNFVQKIDDMHVAAFLSPLHDKDTDEYGVIKKPHYHLMVMYDSVHTTNQFYQQICIPIGAVMPEMVSSRRGMARYLCHMDHPDKYQYDINSVRSFCGISYANIVNTEADVISALGDIMDFVSENKIYNFSYLIDFARKNNPSWFAILISHHNRLIQDYIKSLRYSETQRVLQESDDFRDFRRGWIPAPDDFIF